MAIVAELIENDQRKIIGVVSLIIEPDGKKGEIAFIVADPWQNLGLGSKIVDYMIEICKDKKIETIHAIMLPDNYRAIQLLERMGFSIQYSEDTTEAILNLMEEESEGR
jgi:acetyltransferase